MHFQSKFLQHSAQKCKNYKPRIVKAIMSKNNAGLIVIPDINMYYRAIETKSVWYWQKLTPR